MQKLNLFEYAILQFVPRVERGEYMNVGLILFCKRKNWIKMEFYVNGNLFNAFTPDINKMALETNLQAFQEIASGTNKNSPISQLDVPERFRWLTAVRSSILQTSRPHAGKCEDLETAFTELFKDLVL